MMLPIGRTTGAFLAAAVAVGISAALIVLPFEPRAAWPAGKIAAEFALLVALVLGIPAHALLRRAGKTSLRFYLMAGVVLSGVVTGLFVSLGFKEFPGVLEVAGLALAFGLVGTLTFWLIARPDRAVR